MNSYVICVRELLLFFRLLGEKRPYLQDVNRDIFTGAMSLLPRRLLRGSFVRPDFRGFTHVSLQNIHI